MKPAKKVQAWKCGLCANTFIQSKHAKRFAEACCMCVIEGCGRPSGRIGGRTECRHCMAKRGLASARQSLDGAIEWLAKAEKEWEAAQYASGLTKGVTR